MIELFHIPHGRPRANFSQPNELRYSRRMAVDPQLLEILVCPACKAPVRPIKDGLALKCEKCRRVYPVRDDIPVMLVDEATIED